MGFLTERWTAFLSWLFERLGLNSFVSGDYQAAEAWFKRLEKREPESVRVLHNLGVIRLAQGDFAGAGAYLLREEAVHGTSFPRHYVLADLAYAQGDRAAALDRYRFSLTQQDAPSPGTPPRRFVEMRIGICQDADAYEESRTAAQAFEEGTLHERGGDPQASLEAYHRAAALDPTHWPALNNAGGILLNSLNNPQAALACFEQALRITEAPAVARNAGLAKAAIRGSAT